MYEHALQINVQVPENWQRNRKGFWIGFKECHNLAIQSPEATSLARATAFNRHTVGEFYANLANVMNKHKFPAQDVYNLDETGCTTVIDKI